MDWQHSFIHFVLTLNLYNLNGIVIRLLVCLILNAHNVVNNSTHRLLFTIDTI